MKPANTTEDFDLYAESYNEVLGDALKASGEGPEYFSRGRVKWLGRCLNRIDERVRYLLDYGCGTGATIPILLEVLGAETAVGLDTSARSLSIARRNHGSDRVVFSTTNEYSPSASVDLAYCNGVFHHIPPSERRRCLEFVAKSLRPGGLFSLWENNPWNPGTRYVMARCAFDQDAITLTPIEARALLRSAGFEILRTDFLFVFPRFLKFLRNAEMFAVRLPFGAQYQILCRRPLDVSASPSLPAPDDNEN